MAATDFGTLFLDSSLRIKRFTEQVTELFSITPSDEGRPITDFAHRLEYDDLVKRRARRARRPHADPARNAQPRRPLVRRAPAPLSHRRRQDRRRGHHLRRHDRAAPGRKRRCGKASAGSGRRSSWSSCRAIRSSSGISTAASSSGTAAARSFTATAARRRSASERTSCLGTIVPGASFAELRVKLLEEGNWNGELKHKTKDGRELTVESRIVLETIDGRQLALESTRDVTERKAWEHAAEAAAGRTDPPGQEHPGGRPVDRASDAALQQIGRGIHPTASTAASPRWRERIRCWSTPTGRAPILRRWRSGSLNPMLSGNPERVHDLGRSIFLPADLATPFGAGLP